MSNKLTVRLGTTAPTDQALSSGELGYDTNNKKLYIGNGIGENPTEINQANPIYIGATASADGVVGLVPSATSAKREFFLKGDGEWSEVNLPSDYIGATPSINGVHGLVPGALISERNYFFRGDGSWSPLDLPSDYVGATAGAAGVHGLVPAASASEKDYFFKGDAQWGAITPSTIQAANKSQNPIAVTLASRTWSSGQYVLSVSGLASTAVVEVYPNESITTVQLIALQSANLLGIAQSTNSITLKAFGIVPVIDLPIKLIIRGDIY